MLGIQRHQIATNKARTTKAIDWCSRPVFLAGRTLGVNNRRWQQPVFANALSIEQMTLLLQLRQQQGWDRIPCFGQEFCRSWQNFCRYYCCVHFSIPFLTLRTSRPYSSSLLTCSSSVLSTHPQERAANPCGAHQWLWGRSGIRRRRRISSGQSALLPKRARVSSRGACSYHLSFVCK